MIEFDEQLQLIIEQIKETSILLEQGKDVEAYSSMSNLVQLLNPILPTIIQSENNEINIDKNKLTKALTQVLGAMEKKDNLLLADMLQYELKDLLIRARNS